LKNYPKKVIPLAEKPPDPIAKLEDDIATLKAKVEDLEK